MFDTIHNHVHHHHGTSKEDHEILHKLLEIVLLNNTQNKQIMEDFDKLAAQAANLKVQVAGLTGKVDKLQVTVDTKQAAIQAAIDALAKLVSQPSVTKEQIAAVAADLQSASDAATAAGAELDTVDADVASTSTEATPDAPPAEGGEQLP